MKLDNRVALITGGSRGIGLATAKLFAAEGAKVVLAARTEAHGSAAAGQIPNAIFVRCDVTCAVDCQRVVEETVRAFGRLNILFNNAGVIYRNRTVEATSEVEWDDLLNTNLKGTFLMSKYALPHLRLSARGGSGAAIVNTASYVALVGYPGLAAYCASKAGIMNLTRAMALDHASENIRVNCICPGSVDTEMVHSAWRAYGDQDEAARLWAAKHPMGRIATPEEIARVVLFLASDDSSFITGAAVPVDGGITAG
jgi:NAD(P)-dependent dehydrogenase (short-subunit alcohol dehydrogenase family)